MLDGPRPSHPAQSVALRRFFPDRRGGFALVVALTLMSFILLLLMSLNVLMRTDLQINQTQQVNLEARQNALLGLRMAMGKLQSLAGPDTRVTGGAGLLEDSADPAASPSPLAGHEQWTAVWSADNLRAMDDPDTDKGSVLLNSNLSSYDGSNRKLEPLGWLVSGEPANGGTVSPDQDLADEIVLVGAGSVADTDADGVKVGRVELDAGKGAYAYWVSDESTKARFDAIEPESLRTAAAGSQDALSRVLGTQGLGLQAMWMDEAGTERWLDGGYDVGSETSRNRLRRLGEVGPYLPDATLHDELKRNFHDVTFFSRGLLTNPVSGGLKKDLSVYLQTGIGLNDADPIADMSRFPDLDIGGDNLVRWGKLRDWANLPTPLQAQLGSDQAATISPVITFAGFDVGLSLAGDVLSYHLFPEIVVWNPYDSPIEAPSGYTVTWRIGKAANILVKDLVDTSTVSAGDSSAGAGAGGTGAAPEPQTYGDLTWKEPVGGQEVMVKGYKIAVGDQLAATMGLSTPLTDSDAKNIAVLRFHLADGAGLTLAPGEVMVFTLASEESLKGDVYEMEPGRLDPIANNALISGNAAVLSPAPGGLLEATYTSVSFDWADVRLYEGVYTTSPLQDNWLQRLSYGSWGNTSLDKTITLDPGMGRPGVAFRNYNGRMAMRPFSYQDDSVWPNSVSYSSGRSLVQYDFRGRDTVPYPRRGNCLQQHGYSWRCQYVHEGRRTVYVCRRGI